MIIISKHSQHVPEDAKNRFFEDFNIKVRINKLPVNEDRPIFSLGLRVKSPYVQSIDESYVNPQTNCGTKQYIMEVFNQKLMLRKTESISKSYEWTEIVTDDGKKMLVPYGKPYILGEFAYEDKIFAFANVLSESKLSLLKYSPVNLSAELPTVASKV